MRSLGSLLVALVQLLKDFLDAQRRNSDSMIASLLLCCITYAVSIVEALLELFNHWAFVQVQAASRSRTHTRVDWPAA